jgi:hypothetical protein
VKNRTRLSRLAGGLLAVLLIGGFTAPNPTAPLPDGVVDDAVRDVVSVEGVAPVIVWLHEQANLDQLGDAADEAAATTTDALRDAGDRPLVDLDVAGAEGLVDRALVDGDTIDQLTGGDLLDQVTSGDVLGQLADDVPGLADGVRDQVAVQLDDLLAEQLSAALDDGLLGDGAAGSDRYTLDDLGLGSIVQDLAGTVRVATVVEGLQNVVATTAPDVASMITDGRQAGQIEDVREFWIFNGFAATVDDAALDALASHPEVASIVLDDEIELADSELAAVSPLGHVSELALFGLLSHEQPVSWGVQQARAPEAWQEFDTRGSGAVVGIMDSGVDGTHPALADSWRGADGAVKTSWFVATRENYSRPADGRGHGTHTAGTIVGESSGQTIGVAPDAQWIAAKVFSDAGQSSASILHAGFQWMLAPGGDSSAAPDVVNNSWGTSARNSTEFWRDVDAWIAAGIVPVFAMGNRGPRAESLSSPASLPHALAVGASDTNDAVTGFSSRGPVTWDGRQHVKPDLAAPGQQIQSAWPSRLGGGYRTATGTSMASPHVAGVAALIRSMQPGASVAEIRRAMEGSARSGASRGQLPDNAYGHGIVDARAALNFAADDR